MFFGALSSSIKKTLVCPAVDGFHGVGRFDNTKSKNATLSLMSNFSVSNSTLTYLQWIVGVPTFT